MGRLQREVTYCKGIALVLLLDAPPICFSVARLGLHVTEISYHIWSGGGAGRPGNGSRVHIPSRISQIAE
jgi:hypothetical protein